MKNVSKIFVSMLAVLLIVAISISFTACDKKAEGDVYFENDMLFEIDPESAVMGFTFGLVSGVFDEEQSYFTFTSNGKVHGQLKTITKEGILDVLGGLLELFDIDISSLAAGLADVDLDEAMVKPYVEPMFPGFDLDHIVESFQLMKKSLGLSLIGFDLENDQIKGIIEYIEETHKVPADLIDRLPDDFSFGIAFDSVYSIKTVTDADGKARKAIYVGDVVAHNSDTQPFVIFSMTTESGKVKLDLTVEFIYVDLVLMECL